MTTEADKHRERARKSWVRNNARKLTATEVKVIELYAGDMPRAEIARELHRSSHTINRHFENIYRKLDIRRSVTLIRWALINANAIAMRKTELKKKSKQ
jgi:DNA-binding NarL/FixJ family response regulator